MVNPLLWVTAVACQDKNDAVETAKREYIEDLAGSIVIGDTHNSWLV